MISVKKHNLVCKQKIAVFWEKEHSWSYLVPIYENSITVLYAMPILIR